MAKKIRDIPEKKNKNESTADSNGDTAQNLLELADQVSKIGENSQTVLEEIGMLRVLASLGLTIGEFTHEVRHVLAALSLSVDALDKKHPEGALQLRNHIRLLSSYMRYFDQAVMQNAHRKLEAHELRDVIGEFVSVMAPTLKRQNVEVETKFEGYDLFTRPMHKSEWASTLLNLFTNSLKAIQRANVKEGKIYIFSSAMDDELLIEFSDNGDGIKKEIREKIFEPFFSTSSPSAALAGHADQITGTGLGLKIVKDIIEAADGEIEAIEPEEGFASRFRITIPRAKKHEISDDQY